METLTDLVSIVSTDLWSRAIEWRLAREAGVLRNPRAVADLLLILALSVALAWCANREAL